MPASFEEATSLASPYLTTVTLSQTNYKVNIDDPMGAEIRITADGMSIYMLYRDPGVYLNDHARRVPEELAAQAGFNVARWAKVRRRMLAQKDAMAAIERDYQDRDEIVVLAAHGEYRVVQVAPGYCNIEFVDTDIPEGDPHKYTILNQRGPVSAEVALKRFEELSGQQPSAPSAEVSQPTEADVVDRGPVRKAK